MEPGHTGHLFYGHFFHHTFKHTSKLSTYRTRGENSSFPPFSSRLRRGRRRRDGGLFFCTSISLPRPSSAAAASSRFTQLRTLFSIFSTTFLLLLFRSFLTVYSHIQASHTNKKPPFYPHAHTNTFFLLKQQRRTTFFFFPHPDTDHGDNELFNKRAKRHTPLFFPITIEFSWREHFRAAKWGKNCFLVRFSSSLNKGDVFFFFCKHWSSLSYLTPSDPHTTQRTSQCSCAAPKIKTEN